MDIAIAKHKFKIGQRVRMTKEALAQGLDGPRAKRSVGVVKGFLKSEPKIVHGKLVTILRDGLKNTQIYHMDFWEPDNGHR